MYSEEDPVLIKYEYATNLTDKKQTLTEIHSDVKTYDGEYIEVTKMFGHDVHAFANKPYSVEYVKTMILLGMDDG